MAPAIHSRQAPERATSGGDRLPQSELPAVVAGVAGDGGALEKTLVLRGVIRCRAMERCPVVPYDEVARAPLVAVDVPFLRRVRVHLADQGHAFVFRQSDHAMLQPMFQVKLVQGANGKLQPKVLARIKAQFVAPPEKK